MSKFLKYLSIELLILLLLLIIISVFNYFSKTQYLIEGFNNNPQLTFFYAEWCGHCKKMLPEWEDFEKKYPSNCKKYESKEISDEMSKKYEINGYPTIVLIQNNEKIKDYTGERNSSSFANFLNEYLNYN